MLDHPRHGSSSFLHRATTVPQSVIRREPIHARDPRGEGLPQLDHPTPSPGLHLLVASIHFSSSPLPSTDPGRRPPLHRRRHDIRLHRHGPGFHDDEEDCGELAFDGSICPPVLPSTASEPPPASIILELLPSAGPASGSPVTHWPPILQRDSSLALDPWPPYLSSDADFCCLPIFLT